MKNLFKKYNIEINSEQEKKFEIYYDLLVYYNDKFNITAITEKEEVYKKHFIDSTLGVEFFKQGNYIDVGSGGGFPAIPIKIIKENLDLTMVEATGKKCEFLKTVCKELNLNNVKVINKRAEEIGRDENYREKFDICSARAVARLNILSEYCLPLIKKGGKFISYKGDATEEIKEAESAVKILGGRIDTVKNYNLDEAKRTLIEIIKINSTDKKYPRSNGNIRKKSL